jgi:5-methylcytosine-specific restriction enzyme subunit McrC
LDEYRIHDMMAYVPGYNPRHCLPPTPRPDIVVKSDGAVRSLLDAKYRDLWERDLPVEMLYQLSIYALSQGPSGVSTILYPTMTGSAREARIEIRNPVDRSVCAEVRMRPVHLDQLDDIILTGKPRERAELAHRLVFGAVT